MKHDIPQLRSNDRSNCTEFDTIKSISKGSNSIPSGEI